MNQQRVVILCMTAIMILLATPVLAVAAEPPKMTPEQQAEMDAYMKAATPGPQHQWLASHAGTYDIKMKSWQEAGAPPAESTGTATRKMSLDGRVMTEEFSSTLMGQPFIGYGMSGYDNVTGKYWGTWNDNMMTGIVVTDGSCDVQKVCTFTGSYNDPIKKAPTKARMTSRWTSPTTELFEMFGPGKDGKEMKMMEITYTKRK